MLNTLRKLHCQQLLVLVVFGACVAGPSLLWLFLFFPGTFATLSLEKLLCISGPVGCVLFVINLLPAIAFVHLDQTHVSTPTILNQLPRNSRRRNQLLRQVTTDGRYQEHQRLTRAVCIACGLTGVPLWFPLALKTTISLSLAGSALVSAVAQIVVLLFGCVLGIWLLQRPRRYELRQCGSI
jgi:hypothetical protein